MNFSEQTKMVFVDEYGQYGIGLGVKQKDGSFKNKIIKAIFNKDVELENKTLIKLKGSRLEFYDWEKEGKKGTTYYVRVFDFDVVGVKDSTPKVNPSTQTDFTFNVVGGELPF